MNLKLNNKKGWMLMSFIVVTALIPIVITAFELITTDNHSVVFLANYPTALSTLVLIYYGLLLAFGSYWFIKQIVSLLMAKNEKTKSELLLLQSQVNPHFFFNMLNNLYGLVASSPSKAQALIIKLSDMMRYSIYESKNEQVLLSAEVQYLKNYIELQEMRYQKKMDLTFNVEIMNDCEVAPLLFIILVENAFKHGIENLTEGAYVRMDMKANKEVLVFEIENNFEAGKEEHEKGIGLVNLKRRLQLAYPKRHKLTNLVSNNIYKTTLSIQLK